MRLGPELEKVQQEIQNYRRFVELTKELVELNEKICQLRPARHMTDEAALEALKKTLLRQFSRKSTKRSSAP